MSYQVMIIVNSDVDVMYYCWILSQLQWSYIARTHGCMTWVNVLWTIESYTEKHICK
jgi:hypothetical protein